MSRLSDTLQRTLDGLKLSAAQLERSSELPAMSIKNIFKGSHPRADRFDKLLASISSLELRVDLIIAYVLDDSPGTYTAEIEAVLREHLHPLLRAKEGPINTASIVQELATARPLSTATKARQVLDQMRQRLDSGDTVLADWLADTGTLLTAAHLPAETPAVDFPATSPTQAALREGARQFLQEENPPATAPPGRRTAGAVPPPQPR